MRSWHSQGKSKKEKVKSKKGKGKILFVPTFAFLLFTFSFALSGCALWQPREADPPLRDATVEQLTELLQVRAQALRTIKGLFTAQINGPGIPIAQTLHGTLVYRRPYGLRLQGFSRFGGKVIDFLLAPGRYVLKLPTEGKVFTGAPADFGKQEGLSQPVSLSVLAMTGVIGIAAVGPDEPTLLAEVDSRYRLDVHPLSPDGPVWGRPLRRIWFDRRSFQVVQEDRFTADGEMEGTLLLEDFREVPRPFTGDVPTEGYGQGESSLILPFKVTATSGRGEGRIRVTFSELIPNVPLRDDEFLMADGDPPSFHEGVHETTGG